MYSGVPGNQFLNICYFRTHGMPTFPSYHGTLTSNMCQYQMQWVARVDNTSDVIQEITAKFKSYMSHQNVQ